jgi:hypothetical protein
MVKNGRLRLTGMLIYWPEKSSFCGSSLTPTSYTAQDTEKEVEAEKDAVETEQYHSSFVFVTD